jgi:hypothetical protein
MLMLFAEVFSDLQGSDRRAAVDKGNLRGRKKVRHGDSFGTFQVHTDNLPSKDCRALKTAKGTADYFPARVLYFVHTRQIWHYYTRKMGKKKGQTVGWRCRLWAFSEPWEEESMKGMGCQDGLAFLIRMIQYNFNSATD